MTRAARSPNKTLRKAFCRTALATDWMLNENFEMNSATSSSGESRKPRFPSELLVNFHGRLQRHPSLSAFYPDTGRSFRRILVSKRTTDNQLPDHKAIGHSKGTRDGNKRKNTTGHFLTPHGYPFLVNPSSFRRCYRCHERRGIFGRGIREENGISLR